MSVIKINKWSIILLFIIGISRISFAQNIQVSSKIDTNLITIGDQFKLTLNLTKQVSQNVNFPMLLDTIITEIEIVEEKELDTINTFGENISLQKEYILTSFDSGIYALPPFNFTLDSLDTIPTQEQIFVQVLTLKVDTTQQKIADIKEPFQAPMTFMEFINEYYPYILGGVILIALIILALWYYRKLKRAEPIEKPRIEKPKEPAHIVAYRDLKVLKEKKLWQNSHTKDYYVELTDILRRYLYNRFDIYAPELTSDEILQELNNIVEISEELKNKTRVLLTTADFVKFAKASPLPNEHDASMKTTYTFVEQTMKRETEVQNN